MLFLRFLPLVWLFAGGATAQVADLSFLATRPEATGYEETSRYDEVMAFLDVVSSTSPRLHLTHFGYSTEGRRLPLVVYGNVRGAGPEAVRTSGKTRILVLANIHAGEVAGKEAVLMLLRGLAAGQHTAWADSLVVFFAPIYNADGNERISLYHRPLQHGPIGGMGQRPNAQGLDLNRDHMKLDAPETRSLVRLMQQFDPHVVVDLHTTNGTHHAYHLTYAPPLHPNTYGPITAFLRERWLPAVTSSIRAKYGWDFYYYGNLPEPGSALPPGWYTFDHRPRFNNNYVGLRGRFAILSEAYAYATFEERIHASYYFLEELLDFASAHAAAIRKIAVAADEDPVAGELLPLRARHARSPEPVEILMGAVEEEKHPYTGERMLHRQDVRRPERMDAYGAFAGTDSVRAPQVYLVPPALAAVVDRLEAHGIRFSPLPAARTFRVERFRIDSMQTAAVPYQGRRTRTLFGAYEAADVALPAGTLLVPVDQPLGRLAFYLLEPGSDDGLAHWALLDDALEGAPFFPILRVPPDE